MFSNLFCKPICIDWDASREAWIESVLGSLIPKLEQDKRFINSTDLTNRFKLEVKTWRKSAKFRPVIEIGNELAAADSLLAQSRHNQNLIYEPPLNNTSKRLDFLRNDGNGICEWIEVKTVSPKWNDSDTAWERFLKFANTLSKNLNLLTSKQFSGAAISAQAINARRSIIDRTVEIEAKAKFIPVKQNGPIKLLFCSTGSDWYEDELEDFAYFYKVGKCRDDDWLANLTEQHMLNNNLSFNHSLVAFGYLARKHEDLTASIPLTWF
jgi:hypothetical protein